MDGPFRNLRHRALQKIAALSATSESDHARSDFNKLFGGLSSMNHVSKRVRNSHDSTWSSISLAKAPITVEELQVLFALCRAAPEINDTQAAERLLCQLIPYLLEAHEQAISPSPFLHMIEPSPWEALTSNLVTAILAIGIKHHSLHSQVYNCLAQYLNNCRSATRAASTANVQYEGSGNTRNQKPIKTIVLFLSILGFLEATSGNAYFYNTRERLDLVKLLRDLLSGTFMIVVEGALSSIRTSETFSRPLKDFKFFFRRYASSGRPLGAMLLHQGFLRVLVSCCALELTTPEILQQKSVLDFLMSARTSDLTARRKGTHEIIEVATELAADAMRLLEDGADYLQIGSIWQQHQAFKVKGYAITAFVCCMVIDEEIADADLLMAWLDDAMADTVQLADDGLACVMLKSLSVAAKVSPAMAPTLSRSLPRFIVRGGLQGSAVVVAAKCLASILQSLSQDTVITVLYSLGNVLSSSSAEKGIGGSSYANGSMGTRSSTKYTQHATGSAISLNMSGEEETAAAYVNIVRAIVTIATTCADEKITPLALSMLIQKLGRINSIVDLHIISETADLGVIGGEAELKSLLKMYDRLSHQAVMENNDLLLEAIMKARMRLAESLEKDSPSFQYYLLHLLETIVSKGDVRENDDNKHKADIQLVAQEIGQLLKPLAELAPSFADYGEVIGEESTAPLQREMWFNIVVHGITPGSPLWDRHLNELQQLAVYTKPLVAKDRTDHLESDIELNTVLRRGMNAPHTAEMKRQLIKLLPSQEASIRSLAYPKVIFLLAAYSLETLRADTGKCSDVLSYFIDPSVNQDTTAACMEAIADEVMSKFLARTLGGIRSDSTAPYVANELAQMLATCCHRIYKCQQVAARLSDRLIAQMPSSLCQKSSLFALLELLSLMWSSCLEAELDEYEWKSTYVSQLANVSLELSDDFEFRKRTLHGFHRQARSWTARIINLAPLDVKGLLQTYLSEYDDDGAYGHVSLGRSFAIEMGSVIPSADQRLGALDRQDQCNINTGSDFIAQYTTRQEYRYADALPEYDQGWVQGSQSNNNSYVLSKADQEVRDAQAILAVLERRVSDHKYVAVGELRDILRRAAALLSRSTMDQCAIVHQLVGIPFSIFTKQSIKLGISLWLGVINENHIMESRILVEIARQWEDLVQKKRGIFDDKFHLFDPFFIKAEFAPSDKSHLLKQQQAAQSLISPHLRILQFLSSHFNAYRLGSPHLRRVFQRLIRITLRGLATSTGHPLAREFHFHVILFGLNILRFSDDLGKAAKWRLKDHLLTAALAWFSNPSWWSFGGNRLQIKAECQLMADVDNSLHYVASIGEAATNTLPSLTGKQELLARLLEHEHSRLQVWLFPLSHEQRHIFRANRGPERVSLSNIAPSMLKTAWAEDPKLAIQVAIRSQSPALMNEIRWHLLNYPQKAIGDPEALHILLQDGLTSDISFQLKYLLYWAPVNPITAVTYFLPSYKNNPFIIQYAMRALESHSVDVTFFYVPQIVQGLRYDSLGYVERYIIETAKFSQLFAHQIIWSIKANAYKDEDSTIEDPIKPTLDKVMNNIVASFSETDRLFYEREFAFFNEVTGISGTLRPYIKREKAEKKQKIEEELRKIKVDVGVYLPCNPDGVVVGIDRKSGKPLQSHAKAPYMATFRVRKNKSDMEGTEEMLESTHRGGTPSRRGLTHETTYEVWQSAIFKVGDDCRQDVLALQMIAAFRGIFNNIGLDVYVYPNRVTATAPGCGVIEVLPNSISRDMLGREAVNGLYEYFVSKYGGENSIRFQEARNNFVKSMAAYSVISYLLQFKDRHNGNIMIDDAGHIIHIDFGFCFDIAPGGVKFERAPFKLTSEMVSVMGGSTSSQSYKWFEELCVKAFLASRPYTEKLAHMVMLMLDSGLPCFKPETIRNFKDRFVLEKSEREAAEFMKDLVTKSFKSHSTKGYDQFQLLTNGIPY